MSAEENSPADCFCRRGQGAKRREGARECAEKSLALRQNEKQVARPAFCIGKINKGDSNKEGADLSAEENSPVDCF